MLRATLKSLLSRKLRLMLSGLAVVLGVMFVSGALILTDTLGRSFERLFAGAYEDTDVVVEGVPRVEVSEMEGEQIATPIPVDTVDQVTAVPGVAQATGLVWADGAVVHEWIPATRARAAWLLQRAYRSGNSWSLCEYDLFPSLRTRASRIAKGIGRVGQGALTLPASVVTGRRGAVKSLQYIFLGAGAVTGALGLRYEEYRKVHGD
jgi:hypothetical protein